MKGEDVSDENWSCNDDGSARKLILVYASEEAADRYVANNAKNGERSLGGGWTSMTINTPADIQTLLDTRSDLKYILESGML